MENLAHIWSAEMEADFFESVAAAEREIRAQLSVEVIRELNQQSAPHNIERITALLEQLAVWVAARRHAGGVDIYHYWQQRRKTGLKLVPLLRSHSLRLKELLEEARDARLLNRAEDKLDELDDWIDDFDRTESILKEITVRRGAVGRPQDRDLVLIIANVWRDVTGTPPPIDRFGRFYRFLHVFLRILPLDSQPRYLPQETVKDWITQYRKGTGSGGK